MDWMLNAILIGAGLIALSVLSSTLAFRFGTPLLLVFLGIGVLAGEDGLGLVFDHAEVAYFVCSIALAVILFDSGFGTRKQTLRRAAAPAFALATAGVALTTVLVGAAAYFLLNLPWLYALLMGAIVSSTDAAAVFFLLRTGGVKIYKRVRSMLEVESGSNDPMAIFLTILLVEMILSDSSGNVLMSFAQGFGLQMGLGLIGGLVGGYAIVQIVNRVNLEEALYSILVMACALCVFAATATLGGSGFLAVYVAGIVAGNLKMQKTATLRRYQEGATWLAQIVMFLILGLFVTPSEFGSVFLPALLLGLFLIFVGRPLAVWLCLLPFRYDRQTVLFTGWVGLRGAVSILLAILPIVMMVDGADVFVNVAFIMVVTSLLIQGWTIKPAAQYFGLVVPSRTEPLARIELELPSNARHELLVYKILPDSPLIQAQGMEGLPRWARPSLIVRQGRPIQLEPAEPLRVDDLVYIFAPPEYAALLDLWFAETRIPDRADVEYFGHPLANIDERLSELLHSEGLEVCDLHVPPEMTIREFVLRELGTDPVVGDRVPIGHVDLVVRRVHQGRVITEIGLSAVSENRTPAHVRASKRTRQPSIIDLLLSRRL